MAPTRRAFGDYTPWSKQEDDKLRTLVAQYGTARGKNSRWQELAEQLPGRSAKNCRKRWFYSLDPTVKRSTRWSPEEDARLRQLMEVHGKLWWRIAQDMEGRTDDQCAARYHNVLSVTDRPWSSEEDSTLLVLQAQLGNKWKEIATHFEGRSALSCRNRCRKFNTSSAKSPGRVSSGVPCAAVGSDEGLASPAPAPTAPTAPTAPKAISTTRPAPWGKNRASSVHSSSSLSSSSSTSSSSSFSSPGGSATSSAGGPPTPCGSDRHVSQSPFISAPSTPICSPLPASNGRWSTTPLPAATTSAIMPGTTGSPLVHEFHMPTTTAASGLPSNMSDLWNTRAFPQAPIVSTSAEGSNSLFAALADAATMMASDSSQQPRPVHASQPGATAPAHQSTEHIQQLPPHIQAETRGPLATLVQAIASPQGMSAGGVAALGALGLGGIPPTNGGHQTGSMHNSGISPLGHLNHLVGDGASMGDGMYGTGPGTTTCSNNSSLSAAAGLAALLAASQVPPSVNNVVRDPTTTVQDPVAWHALEELTRRVIPDAGRAQIALDLVRYLATME